LYIPNICGERTIYDPFEDGETFEDVMEDIVECLAMEIYEQLQQNIPVRKSLTYEEAYARGLQDAEEYEPKSWEIVTVCVTDSDIQKCKCGP
jgi:hypothetical protein